MSSFVSMATTNEISRMMNSVTLDEEEEGGLALEVTEEEDNQETFHGFDAKLCLMGRFITEGVVDFIAMKQTLAALWRPGRGVHIREIDVNLYLFQFYHEVDIKRVVEGSPWSFNRKALVIARMKDGDVPRSVRLNSLDLWVQIHDLRAGFMTEKIVKEVGNYIGCFVESCPRNFTGVWKEYLRVRVTIDLSKPLKRRMKIRKAGDGWEWIMFKYENVPTFCFICGLLGHSEKYCSILFEKPEDEIIKPYGVWMRAPLRRPTKLIGAKWLREGSSESGRNFTGGEEHKVEDEDESVTKNQGSDKQGESQRNVNYPQDYRGGNSSNSKHQEAVQQTSKSSPTNGGIRTIENKKRRTGSGPDQHIELGNEIEDQTDPVEEVEDLNNPNMQVDPKNVIEAGFVNGVRLSK